MSEQRDKSTVIPTDEWFPFTKSDSAEYLDRDAPTYLEPDHGEPDETAPDQAS